MKVKLLFYIIKNIKIFLILQINHCYTDGIGLASLFLHMFGVTSQSDFITLQKPNKFLFYF